MEVLTGSQKRAPQPAENCSDNTPKMIEILNIELVEAKKLYRFGKLVGEFKDVNVKY